MSNFLQILIDEEAAKIHDFLSSLASNNRDDLHNFFNFARAVRDSQCEIRPAHMVQILDLMDSLQAHGKILDSHRHWTLATFALKAALEDGDDPAILSRVVLESVKLSLSGIAEKLSNPVVGDRDFFRFFAENSSVLSDDAYRAVWDNSVILTRYCAHDTSRHNLLFGSTNTYFQESIAANRALSGLIANYSYDHEAYIDWSEFGQASVDAERLIALEEQILRAHAAGVRIVPHQSDALLILGFAENLLGIRSMGDSRHAEAIDHTITALFDIVRLDGSQPLGNNLFRCSGRPRTLQTSGQNPASNWLFQLFCSDFHSDLLRSMSRLKGQELAPSVKLSLQLFAGQVLRSSAQANAPLFKESNFDNKGFISDVIAEFPSSLSGENPLQGLKKVERLAILEAVTDVDIKRQLLKKYKSEKGHVLMHDLGM